MYQINSNTVPTIFLNKFKKSTHNYPTNVTKTNYLTRQIREAEHLN